MLTQRRFGSIIENCHKLTESYLKNSTQGEVVMKKMLLIVLVLCVNFVGVSQLHAAESYATMDWVSQYVIGSGFVNYNHPALQVEVGSEFKNGLGGSVWGSVPASLYGIGNNMGTEVDLNLWYHVNKHLTVGAAYFFLSPDLWGKENDVIQANAEVDGSLILFGDFSVKPGFRVEYDAPADGGPYNKFTTGLYLIPMVGLNYKVNSNLNVSMNTRFTADLGGYGAEKSLIAKFSPRVTYQASKNLSVNAGMDIYIPTFKTNDEVRTNLYVSRVGVSYAF
jgi:hypothetical protein